jgi:hypothetical protein
MSSSTFRHLVVSRVSMSNAMERKQPEQYEKFSPQGPSEITNTPEALTKARNNFGISSHQFPLPPGNQAYQAADRVVTNGHPMRAGNARHDHR